jgi:subtilisin family serine protease
MSRTTKSGPILVAALLTIAAPAQAHAAPERWLVAARPSAATAQLAHQHGARPLRLRGVYSVTAPRARALKLAFARAGVLRYAEPDVQVAHASTYETGTDETYTRGTVIAPGLTPPAAFAPIGLVDDLVDASAPDVSQAKGIKSSPAKSLNENGDPITAHGTEVASVAAGRADGQGVIGIAPGAPLLSYGYEESGDPTCQEVVDGVLDLADAGAKVINLSLEADQDCHTLELAIGAAYGDGALVVASAGNAGQQGSPTTYPAVYPHVLTVGALGLDLAPASFSTAGPGLDLVAPGESVPVALPPGLDRDGTADGLTRATGTSFAAPIVSGAASWLIAARPRLTPSQYGDLLRATATEQAAAGWDAKTGFGLVDLAAALQAPVPKADRGEPDDGIDFVDGSAFTKPDPFTSGTVKATIAPVEDPADVYRVRIRAHGRGSARLTGGAGASVYVYSGKVQALTARALAKSRTKVTFRNDTRRAATFYVAVRAAAGAKRTAASNPYTLAISRR